MSAHGALEAQVARMRARFVAISQEIANELSALAKSAAQSASVREADLLSVAAQIAAAQARLCAEVDRLPASLQASYGLLQNALQAQQQTLLQLGVVARQHASPQVTQIRAQSNRPPRGPEANLAPSVLNAHRATATVRAEAPVASSPFRWPSGSGPAAEEASAPLGNVGGIYVGPADEWEPPPDEVGDQPPAPHRSPRRAGATGLLAYSTALVSGAVSRSLALMAVLGAGLLVAYATFPRAGDEAAEPSKRLELPRRAADAVPPPVADGPRIGSPPLRPLEPRIDTHDATVQIQRDRGGIWPQTAATSPQPAAPRSPGIVIDEPKQAARPVKTDAMAANAVVPAPAAAPRVDQFVAVVFTHQQRAAALLVFGELQEKYAKQLGRRQGEAQPVDLGKKGVWHRLVVLPAGSRKQASALCSELAAAGYDKCWVKVY